MPYNDYVYSDTEHLVESEKPARKDTKFTKTWEQYLKDAENLLDNEPYHVTPKIVNEYATKLYYQDLDKFRKDNNVDASGQREIDHWKYMYENAMDNYKHLRATHKKLEETDNIQWKAEYEVLLKRTQTSEKELERLKRVAKDTVDVITQATNLISDQNKQLESARLSILAQNASQVSEGGMEMIIPPESTPIEDCDDDEAWVTLPAVFNNGRTTSASRVMINVTDYTDEYLGRNNDGH